MRPNRRVLKYQLALTHGDQLVQVGSPEAQVLHVGMQDEALCVWVECHMDQTEYGVKTFRVHGTGDPIESGFVWRGTTQDGPFVWHVYEQTR